MNGFLLLLCCIAILAAQPCIAGTTVHDPNEGNINPTTASMSQPLYTATSSSVQGTSPSATPKPQVPTTTSTSPTTMPTATTKTFGFFDKIQCRLAILVVGGLILACAILLLSTLLLACKVCKLSRRLRMLSTDLIGSSEDWMVNAKKNNNKCVAEAKETDMLMADVGQTKEDLDHVTTKEEEGENKKAVGGAANSETDSTVEGKNEAITVVECSPASQPQEDTTTSQSNVAAASPTEDTEEAKAAV